jgi:hypothetical protein
MGSFVLADETLHFATATYTTIILSLLLSGFGFFASGYYAGHSTLSTETSSGLRRIWIAVFLLIGTGGITFAIRETLFTPLTHGQYADPAEVTFITLVSLALGAAVSLVAIVGLHERFGKATAWTIATLPITAFAIAETLVIHEALRPAGTNQGPESALFYFGAFEIVTTIFMLFVVYGPRALRERDPNALLMLTGLVLFLVAPLIYTLGSSNDSSGAVINSAGWFIACHVAGLYFVFLASLPAGEAVAVQSSVSQPLSQLSQQNVPVALPSAVTPRYIERDDSVAYPRAAATRIAR